MQPSNTSSDPITPNPRDKIIDIYNSTIEDSFHNNRPAIKLINFGTGSGKTHQLFQSVCQTIMKHPYIQVVGVYVAPLREHLHTAVKQEFPDIPFYILYSHEQRVMGEFLLDYKKWVPLIKKDKGLWDQLAKASKRDISKEKYENLSRVLSVIKKYEFFSDGEFGNRDDLVQQQLLTCQREINRLMEDFLEFLIKNIPDEKEWSAECLELVKVFFPLHLLREQSGILLLTYEKFERRISYFHFNGGKWVKRSAFLDKYVAEHSNDSRKFIFAFDEQEDGYQIMLDHQIDIISPRELAINNALSSITREFSVLFSTKYVENRELLHFLKNNPGAYQELEEHFEKEKVIEANLVEFAPTYRRLVYEEGNSQEFLRQVAIINEEIEDALQNVAGVFGDIGEEEPVSLDFHMLSRVFSKFANNRSLLIPQKVYSKFSDDLMNIFSYNNLFIYNIEPLKKLFLANRSDGHVHITEGKTPHTASVAELIYAIFAVRLQIESIRSFLSNVLDAEDSQSRSLDIWSSQIGKIKEAGEPTQQPSYIKYLNRDYVYLSLKTIINILEIARYQHPKNNLINSSMREVSIGSTAIMTSPEYRITSALENNSNVIFLISATGGIAGDLTTSFDLSYLEDKMRDEFGKSTYSPMRKSELDLSEQIRQFRGKSRQVSVDFFTEDNASFPNIQTVDAVKRFDEFVLKSYLKTHEDGGRYFGVYKTQELRNFVHFLFYLLEDETLRETIAFTQTTRWILDLVNSSARNNYDAFRFTRSDENPNIFYFELAHKTFQSKEKVKLIFYEAKFNQLYSEKSKKKSYLEELVEEENQKIFFISAYQSAAKGLNPTIKTQDGASKDFDSIILLMDRYYSVVGPAIKKAKGDPGKAETQFHFALMKSVVRQGDTKIEIKDFNKYLTRPETGDFQKLQHQILMGKEILQAIGRTERREFPRQIMKIFINEETRQNLVNFYRYLDREEPNEIRKFSVNNFAVYERVREEERQHTIQNYEDHAFKEIDASIAIQRFRKKMLDEIDLLHQGKATTDIVQAWNLLRDPNVFQDPEKYMALLKNSGLFPEDFVNALFYNSSEQPAFIPYLATEKEDGQTFQIISDSAHGDKVYPYLDRLFPDYMKMNAGGYDLEGTEILGVSPSTIQIQKLYKKLVPNPSVFGTYIPRPPFFYDVLYPSLTENFTEAWVQHGIFNGKDWQRIKADYKGFEPLVDLQRYNKLYELFDLFYIKGSTLFCIDVKAWSLVSGYRLSQKTVNKAKTKLTAIAQDYPEFRKVNGLLLNLHASQEKSVKYQPNLFSGNLICTDSNHLPVESNVLRSFLFQREE